MIKTRKKGDKLIITIECNHSIVDDCFLFASMDAASEGKRLIMEEAGKAYENYVKENALLGDREYLDRKFQKVSIQID